MEKEQVYFLSPLQKKSKTASRAKQWLQKAENGRKNRAYNGYSRPRSHTGHIQVIYRSHTDHMQVTNRSHTSHIEVHLTYVVFPFPFLSLFSFS